MNFIKVIQQKIIKSEITKYFFNFKAAKANIHTRYIFENMSYDNQIFWLRLKGIISYYFAFKIEKNFTLFVNFLTWSRFCLYLILIWVFVVAVCLFLDEIDFCGSEFRWISWLMWEIRYLKFLLDFCLSLKYHSKVFA